MKKLRLILLVLTVMLSATRAFADSMLSAAADLPGVTYVSVGKAMLRSMSSMLSRQLGGKANLDLRKIDYVEIATAEDGAVKKLRDQCRRLLPFAGKAENMIVSAKDGKDGEKVDIYARTILPDGTARDLVIMVSEGNEFTVILLQGQIGISDINVKD